MTLMPGLTDAHVHIGAVDVNILEQHREHPSNLVALMMARILEDTLQQGFTTVRDAGGTDWSFKAAVERGIVDGPRLLISDPPLSQTGGTVTGAGRPRPSRRRSSAPPLGCARWCATGPTR
jgi:imidazolonepropionase-like amidohydrolase